jgi:hypothetical protein
MTYLKLVLHLHRFGTVACPERADIADVLQASSPGDEYFGLLGFDVEAGQRPRDRIWWKSGRAPIKEQRPSLPIELIVGSS